jgi:ketosteroid isomerase-like protein
VRRFMVLLALVVVALLGIVVPWGLLGAMAQDASPATLPAALSPLLQQWVDGVVAGNGEAIAALYTEDAVQEDVPAGLVVEGPEEIGALVSGTVT